jgi:MFS family permease
VSTTIASDIPSRPDGFDLVAVQRRTMRTVLASQISGGVGIVSGYTVTALLAYELTGSATWAGLSAAANSIGSAAVAFPLAKYASRVGRRPAMRTGYIIASAGSFVALMAAVTGWFFLLPLGVLGIGAGTATNLSARYAASDLVPPEKRARTIGLIVWATTIGSGVGSLVSLSVLDPMGQRIGLPNYAGSFMAAALLFLLAGLIIEFRLRPDPLILAGGVGLAGEPRLPFSASMRLIMAVPSARLAVIALMVSQATMVSTMTMTPLHMSEGGQSGTAISLMLFSHVLGMYLFAPLIGVLTDWIGRTPMIFISGLIGAIGAIWAGLSPGNDFFGLTGGMTLAGISWCFGVIAASGLLTDSFPVQQRASVQGAGDLCMAAFGSLSGIVAGSIVAVWSYKVLNLGAAGFGVGLMVFVLVSLIAQRSAGPVRTVVTAISLDSVNVDSVNVDSVTADS